MKKLKILIKCNKILINNGYLHLILKNSNFEIFYVLFNDFKEIENLLEIETFEYLILVDSLDNIRKYKLSEINYRMKRTSNKIIEDIIKNNTLVKNIINEICCKYDFHIYTYKLLEKSIISNIQKWEEKYFKREVINLKKILSPHDFDILKKLKIKFKNKIYTEYEFEILTMELYSYYEQSEYKVSKTNQKSLDGTGVTKKEYNELLKKIEEVNENF